MEELPERGVQGELPLPEGVVKHERLEYDPEGRVAGRITEYRREA